MKNDPRMMSDTKYAHVKFVPTASLVYRTENSHSLSRSKYSMSKKLILNNFNKHEPTSIFFHVALVGDLL